MIEKINKWLPIINIVVIIVLAIMLVGGNTTNQFGGGTRFQNGISADNTSPSAGQVRGTTLTITGAQTLTGATTLSSTLGVAGISTFNGQTISNAGNLHSYVNSTSTTATTQTLLAADILNYETIILTPNTGALTLTFPASSTLSAMIPTAGDWMDQCWYNATTTASQTITFAAGTGIDFQRTATTTTVGGDTTAFPIDAGGYACLRYIRQPATASTFDIGVLMTGYLNAD